MGNFVLWQTGAVVVSLSFALLVVFGLWNLRYPQSLPVSVAQWNRITATGELLLLGFLFNWLLFFFTDRTLFFHHYFPGLAFKFLIVGSFFGELREAFENRYELTWRFILREAVFDFCFWFFTETSHLLSHAHHFSFWDFRGTCFSAANKAANF